MGMGQQVPAIALPHEEDARQELLYPLPSDFTAKGVVALVVIIGAAMTALFVLRLTYWYLGLGLLAVVALLFFSPFFRNTRRRVKRRNSND